MSTPSLGDLLRQTIDRNIIAEQRARQEKLDKERAQQEREEGLIRDLFATAMSEFSADILSGNKVKPIIVGKGKNVEVSHLTNKSSGDINKPSNQFFSLWKEFSDWADSQGLEAVWEYADDGFGRQDWRVLTVRPKASQ